MSNPLFQALSGKQAAAQAMPDPQAYRNQIQQEITNFQRSGRDPASELQQFLQRSGLPPQAQQFYRNLGHAVATRLFGGNR